MKTYEIVLDAYALTDDARATDSEIETALVTLAHDAGATFTNVRILTPNDAHRFASSDVTVRFDANADDVRRYADTYDMDEIDAV